MSPQVVHTQPQGPSFLSDEQIGHSVGVDFGPGSNPVQSQGLSK